jgi:hypothetical protein
MGSTMAMDWTAVGVVIAGGVAVAGGLWHLFSRLEGRFERLVDQVDARFDQLDARFDRFAEQSGHFDKALDRLAGETARGFAAVNSRVDDVRAEMTSGFAAVNSRVDDVRAGLRGVRTALARHLGGPFG